MPTSQPTCSKEAKAARLKILRKMTELSRRDFDKQFNIPRGSLQNWEDARYGGLTAKGAQKVIKAISTVGIECQLNWLLTGEGAGPVQHYTRTSIHNDQSPSATDEIKQIYRELSLFREFYHGNILHTVIQDDGVLPYLQLGDYVAGERLFGDKIQTLIGEVCLVELDDHSIIVRQLKVGQQGLFNLLCLNRHSDLPLPVLYDVKLISVAPVLWLRRMMTKV